MTGPSQHKRIEYIVNILLPDTEDNDQIIHDSSDAVIESRDDDLKGDP